MYGPSTDKMKAQLSFKKIYWPSRGDFSTGEYKLAIVQQSTKVVDIIATLSRLSQRVIHHVIALQYR